MSEQENLDTWNWTSETVTEETMDELEPLAEEIVQELQTPESEPELEMPFLASEELEDEEREHYPENTCWLCKRVGENGANIRLITDNGFFQLFMCGDCQRRFRVG